MPENMDPSSPLYRIHLAERIELAFDALDAHSQTLDGLKREAAAHEATARVDNHEAFESAKNDNVRKTLVDMWLADNDDYHEAISEIHQKHDEIREVKTEIEKLRLLVTLSTGA